MAPFVVQIYVREHNLCNEKLVCLQREDTNVVFVPREIYPQEVHVLEQLLVARDESLPPAATVTDLREIYWRPVRVCTKPRSQRLQ